MSQDKEQHFVDKTRQTLNQSVDELDAVTLARLKAVRMTALESQHKHSEARHTILTTVMQNRLVLATSMSVILLAGVWVIQKPVLQNIPMDDLHMLTATEDLELYRDLEFYQWLEYQSEQS
ncbi:MAG: DUF3619 family protein [Gammaproteobacteria bacterium]|nr:DUF3619 family protein [Gammaproteobacteria bacterium]